MSTQEFSDQFDILFNNITSNLAPGLNEYEKSVFLTKALNLLVTEYFNARTDGVGGGFDGSQKRQYDFSSLIKTRYLSRTNLNPIYQIDRRSIVYAFPKDFFLAVNEILVSNTQQYSVLPLSYDEYLRLMLKPYNFPVKRGAWRLLSGKDKYNEYINGGYCFYAPVVKADPLTLVISLVLASSTMSGDTTWGASMYMPFGETNVLKVTPNISSTGNTVTLACEVNSTTNITDDILVVQLKKIYEELQYKQSHDTLPSGTNNLVNSAKMLDYCHTLFVPIGGEDFIASGGKSMTATIIEGVPAAEIIGKFSNIPEYLLRYIKKPAPIILEDLTNYGLNLTIDGEDEASECELPSETHLEILERAVTLAKLAWQGGTMTLAAAQQGKDD